MYDIIIKNGEIIDGSGNKGYTADLALTGGKIALISKNITADARQIIDATGLTVTPGFIDSHSHSDLNFFDSPQQSAKVEQGITTAIGGQCGMSLYPRRKAAATGEDIQDKFETFGEFISGNLSTPQGSNLAVFIGHGQLREAVMGMDKRQPTAEELEEMKALLREGIKNGALGISFGLIYTPSCYADTRELTELAKTSAETGGLVVAHIRNEADHQLEAVEEFLQIIKTSGARAIFSHHKAAYKQNHGKVRKSLALISEAIEDGADIYCDVYPYVASSTALEARFIPDKYRKGAAELVAFLQNTAIREELTALNQKEWGDDLGWVLINECAGYPQYEGKDLNEIAEIHGKSIYDTVFDLLTESGGHCDASYFSMSEQDVETVMRFPRTMIGTDGGAVEGLTTYHPRLRGTFPRVLGRYVRERGVVALPEMIRKITSLPAYVYGLSGKGLIEEGYDADLCIFDAEKIIDRADFTHCDRRAEGLNYVIIGGEIVAENATANGKLKGRLIPRR